MNSTTQERTNDSLLKKRIRFSEREDHLIKMFVAENGITSWNELGKILSRNPKQIRDRYNHYLKETLINCAWSIEEDQLLLILMNGTLRGKWHYLEKYLRGRNQIQIKNRWRKLSFQQSIQFPHHHFNSESILISPTQYECYKSDTDSIISSSLDSIHFQTDPFPQVSILPSQIFPDQFDPVKSIHRKKITSDDGSIHDISSLLNHPVQNEEDKIKHQKFPPIEAFLFRKQINQSN
jgi:hypothetical protein